MPIPNRSASDLIAESLRETEDTMRDLVGIGNWRSVGNQVQVATPVYTTSVPTPPHEGDPRDHPWYRMERADPAPQEASLAASYVNQRGLSAELYRTLLEMQRRYADQFREAGIVQVDPVASEQVGTRIAPRPWRGRTRASRSEETYCDTEPEDL